MKHKKQSGYWYYDTTINRVEFIDDSNVEDEFKRLDNQIGNLFETKEEAELAICKLKAWKRLNNCGLKFIDWWLSKDNHIIIGTNRQIFDIDEQGLREDLDLLFSGEDD